MSAGTTPRTERDWSPRSRSAGYGARTVRVNSGSADSACGQFQIDGWAAATDLATVKRAVSISLGASARDYECETELLGRRVSLKRIGTDGDMLRAEELLRGLDGTVDALGLGGADLGLSVGDRWYPLHAMDGLRRAVRRTPLVDGTGLKRTLEKRVAERFLQDHAKEIEPRRAFLIMATDRWGLTEAFMEADFELLLGDLMFSLGLPLPLRRPAVAKSLARWCVPLIGRLPFHWIYPTGNRQSANRPRHRRHYDWATVIVGDCHYIRSTAPERLDGKYVLTNTTTAADVSFFRGRGVKALVTTTPRFGSRTFGTNLLEAALIAVADRQHPLSLDEYDELVRRAGFGPEIMQLND